MRPRSKEQEIGPHMKYRSKLQIERIYEQLIQRRSPIFEDKSLTDNRVHASVRKYLGSGEH
jgi:hypothetical protein